MSPKRKPAKTTTHKFSHTFLIAGISLTGLGMLLLLAIFIPVVTKEYAYQLQSKTGQFLHMQPNEEKPIDEMFGIIIPKIRANAAVIPDVDPYDYRLYQRALTKGVAHAKGSVYPGKAGNVFIFSHSSVNFFEALRYNSVFYLLDKLEPNDEIHLYFNKEKFAYHVTNTSLIEPNDIFYLTEKTVDKRITLMTCWPPGTTYKRLIVRGILQED